MAIRLVSNEPNRSRSSRRMEQIKEKQKAIRSNAIIPGRVNSQGTRENLREVGALCPDAAVEADDGSGGEAAAVDIAHEMLIYVRLPRHF